MATTMLANSKMPNTGGWQDRHNDAVKHLPIFQNKLYPFETAMVEMLKGWAQYANDHKARYESPIGDDGVLGKEWEAIGLGIRGLLNGETGRLDCGTLDSFILNTLKENGIDTSNSDHGCKKPRVKASGENTSMIASMVESARKATSPIVAIPVPGSQPFCIQRKTLVESLKGLRIIDAAIQLPLDGNRANMRLEVYAVADGVKAVRRFAPNPVISCNAKLPLYEWAANERQKRTTPKIRTSARYKKIEQLRKKLATMGSPKPPQHPMLDLGQRHTDRRRESDAKELAATERLRAEGSDISGPITAGERWANWKRQANARRWVQSQAREVVAKKLTTAALYRNLESRGLRVQKWSNLRQPAKDRCNDLWGYLTMLWEFCSLTSKPAWYFDPMPEQECGPKHYEYFLQSVRERREIQSQIDNLLLLEADSATRN